MLPPPASSQNDFAKWTQKFHSDDAALPSCRKWRVISMEFLHSFLRCYFEGKSVVALQKVCCFLRLPNCLFILGLFVFHLRPHATLFPLLSHFSQWFSPERKERKLLLRASCGLKYKLKITITKGLLKLEVLGKGPWSHLLMLECPWFHKQAHVDRAILLWPWKCKCTNKTETTNKEK